MHIKKQLPGNKLIAFFALLLLPSYSGAQHLRFEITGYDAAIRMEYGKKYEHIMPTHYDAKGKRQGPAAVYMKYKDGRPDQCLFRSTWKDDVFVDSIVWYFRSGLKKKYYTLSHDTTGAVDLSGDNIDFWYMRYEDFRMCAQGPAYEWLSDSPDGEKTRLWQTRYYCNNLPCDSEITYFRNHSVYHKLYYEKPMKRKLDLWYHDNGKLASRQPYKNGLEHGEHVMFHENGKPKLKETYVNGKRQGERKEWHPNGILSVSATYKDDQWIGHYRTYDSLGRKKIYRHFNTITLEQDSFYIDYYPAGNMRIKERYHDGNRDGLYQAWWPNGKPAVKGYYKDNSPVGEWIYTDAQGKRLDRFPNLDPKPAAGEDNDRAVTSDSGGKVEYYDDGSYVFRGFDFHLPELPLLRNNVTLQPEDSLAFMAKYPEVEVAAAIDPAGSVNYTIKTAMEQAEQQVLVNWLQRRTTKVKPFEHFSAYQHSVLTFRIYTTP